MAPRKRLRERANPRVVIEVYPEDEDLVHRFRRAALDARVTLREWLLAAGREKLEREPPSDAPPPQG
jgi:hypothetical protein